MPRPRQTSVHRQRRIATASTHDVEDQMARLFAGRFGAQSAQLLSRLHDAYGTRESLPPGLLNRVIGLWAETVDAVPSRVIQRHLVGMYMTLLQRSAGDLRDQIAAAAGVSPTNPRTIARFTRRIGPAIFNVPQSQALIFYDAHAGRLIRKIDDTTRGTITSMVREALTEGKSYTRLEKELIERFRFLGEEKPQKHIRTRARLIAVTETGQAYERGKQSTVHRAEAAGVRFEKAWITVGDDRVSLDCRRNQEAGWIPEANRFPSGVMRPLDHPA